MRTHAETSTQEVLAGLVECVTFHNTENGFCVLRIKARGHRELITTVGHAAVISAGEWVTASGEWVNEQAGRKTAPDKHASPHKFLGTRGPTTQDIVAAATSVVVVPAADKAIGR
jgi:exodeoxyribonuclease V alpha subunit